MAVDFLLGEENRVQRRVFFEIKIYTKVFDCRQRVSI